MYVDKTGQFSDFNFKLIVIDALLNKSPIFEEQLNGLKQRYTKTYKWYTGAGPIIEILNFFSELELDISDLGKITELCFDGGNEIYHIIQPDWDGEDDFFDVTDVAGFQNLVNLKSVLYISMCMPKTLEPMKENAIEIR